MMRDFRGKAVLVTGGASGLGGAIALRFAAAGARLAVLDRDRDALARVAAGLGAAGVGALPLAGDVADPTACEVAVAAAVDRFGGPDVLVNNATITLRSAFAATSPEVIRR